VAKAEQIEGEENPVPGHLALTDPYSARTLYEELYTALAGNLKRAIAFANQVRFFTFRWSCSMTSLRYLPGRDERSRKYTFGFKASTAAAKPFLEKVFSLRANPFRA
jgi:hypothetical protein